VWAPILRRDRPLNFYLEVSRPFMIQRFGDAGISRKLSQDSCESQRHSVQKSTRAGPDLIVALLREGPSDRCRRRSTSFENNQRTAPNLPRADANLMHERRRCFRAIGLATIASGTGACIQRSCVLLRESTLPLALPARRMNFIAHSPRANQRSRRSHQIERAIRWTLARARLESNPSPLFE
jgi:hypothetical protein